jgi:hypothetical protein
MVIHRSSAGGTRVMPWPRSRSTIACAVMAARDIDPTGVNMRRPASARSSLKTTTLPASSLS